MQCLYNFSRVGKMYDFTGCGYDVQTIVSTKPCGGPLLEDLHERQDLQGAGQLHWFQRCRPAFVQEIPGTFGLIVFVVGNYIL